MITYIKEPDWDLISNFEINMVGRYGTLDNSFCEPISDNNVSGAKEVFFSIYQRYDPERTKDKFGGADCIVDCTTVEEATEIYNIFANILLKLRKNE